MAARYNLDLILSTHRPPYVLRRRQEPIWPPTDKGASRFKEAFIQHEIILRHLLRRSKAARYLHSTSRIRFHLNQCFPCRREPRRRCKDDSYHLHCKAPQRCVTPSRSSQH